MIPGCPMENRSLLVFDMDGVLVDVTQSYRETVRKTARLFFKGARGFEFLPNPLFPLDELAEVKRQGGLNNDWDLAFRVISMLFSMVETSDKAPPVGKDYWNLHRESVSAWDVTPLADFLTTKQRGLAGLPAPNTRANACVGRFYQRDVGEGNIIKQIFQEIYLGGDLFRATYGMAPRAHDGEGCIFRERPLVGIETLSRLGSNHIMAIATGRPGSEADFALNVSGLKCFFDVVLTLDDCLAEEKARAKAGKEGGSLSKPDPFMLDTIIERLPVVPARLYYVGDMPDDMIAALRSSHGFVPVGVTGTGPDSGAAAKALIEAGAEFLIGGVEELAEILRTWP